MMNMYMIYIYIYMIIYIYTYIHIHINIYTGGGDRMHQRPRAEHAPARTYCCGTALDRQVSAASFTASISYRLK